MTMRLRVRLGAIVLLALAAAGLWGAPVQGEIVYLDGEVTVDGRPAFEGQPVGRGSTISTGSDSSCEIRFGAENIIALRPGTTLTLELDALQPGARLRSGAVASVLNKVSSFSPRGRFRIRTPSTVAGVRGTVFFVQVEDAATTYVCVCNGEVGVAPLLGAAEPVAGSHHTARRLTKSGLVTRSSAAPLLYHSDGDMDELAAKIGYAVPWGR